MADARRAEIVLLAAELRFAGPAAH